MTKTSTEELTARMASLVWLSVAWLMSVIAILVHPERTKALATAAPIPVQDQHVHIQIEINQEELAGPASTSYDSYSKKVSCK